MIRKAIISGLALLAIAMPSKAEASLQFSDIGVWAQPRFYSGTTFAIEPLNINESYSLKTKLFNDLDQQESNHLTAQITGPENFTLDYGIVTIDPGKNSTRTRTFDGFSTPGNYEVTMNLDNRDSISRPFQVIPEPSTLAILGLGALYLSRKRK